MDVIQEFKQDYESKYKINNNLLQEFQKARNEYIAVKNKYRNTLGRLNGQLCESRKKAQILTEEKVEFEKNLNFAAADKKQKEIERIINNINKISDRSKTVEDTIKNKGGEIKEKAVKLIDIVSELSIVVDRNYNHAFADFNMRREKYNRKIQDEIPQILEPLGRIIWDCRHVQSEIRGY